MAHIDQPLHVTLMTSLPERHQIAHIPMYDMYRSKHQNAHTKPVSKQMLSDAHGGSQVPVSGCTDLKRSPMCSRTENRLSNWLMATRLIHVRFFGRYINGSLK